MNAPAISVDPASLPHELKDGVVQVDAARMMTRHAGIFAGGDMVPAERNVTVAIGYGKKAARHIDAWLRDTTYAPPRKHDSASVERLNPWYYGDPRRRCARSSSSRAGSAASMKCRAA
jgi:hypothetical protein